MKRLQVCMLGDFSISETNRDISNTGNRSRKVWSLIAYLLYHRGNVIRQSELIDRLWGDNQSSLNPGGALKTLLYRARAELDDLWDGAGKQLILSCGDGYCWNNDVEVFLDYEAFEQLGDEDSDMSLDEKVERMALYQGDFLEKMNSELWVLPIAAYYHNQFISSLLSIVPEMIEAGRCNEALRFCSVASKLEPYNEEVHCLYMRAYLACGQQKKAIDVYDALSERLLSDLGVIPSEATRAMYHEAIKTHNSYAISIDTLQGQLRENSDEMGALICEYDFFRVLYFSMARSVMRSGIAVHIALISAVDKNGELPLKKIEKVMPNVEDVIQHSLRRGDSAARCSASQYVIMLPRANYENTCMVCERIIKAYYKKHARNDVILRYEVRALEPDDKENFQWIREPLHS